MAIAANEIHILDAAGGDLVEEGFALLQKGSVVVVVHLPVSGVLAEELTLNRQCIHGVPVFSQPEYGLVVGHLIQ